LCPSLQPQEKKTNLLKSSGWSPPNNTKSLLSSFCPKIFLLQKKNKESKGPHKHDESKD
jgi:hypothetical protein